MLDITRDDIVSATPKEVADVIKDKHAFIAGAGGLGSNVAMLLVRAGIGKITIVDYDTIDASNINRQMYFFDQIGEVKVDALKVNLNRISPFTEVESIDTKLTPDNFASVIPETADIIFECFDNPVCKADLVRHCLIKKPTTPLIAVSGIAGHGSSDTITCKKVSNSCYMIGDETSGIEDGLGTLSSRVMVASAMQANVGINLIIQ